MNKIIEYIKQLTQELLLYCHEYYDLDNPSINDFEYDKKFDELYKLENEANFWLSNSPTRQVQGQVLKGFIKVTHSKPMLSAAKTKDVNEIKKFVENKDFYCSYKLDGLTLVTIWEDGNFKKAVTRGTGLIGEDVTEQAKMIENLPMTIPYKGYLELRGECVISWENFNKINTNLEEPFSHPRNMAAGSLRILNTNITKERKLSYVVFECVSDLTDVDGLMSSKELELRWLDNIGFETVSRCKGNVNDCIETMQPEFYKYPVDGLIFEYDDKQYSKTLGATAHHEGCRMAYKWSDDEYETVLRKVEWQTSRTGLINPVAVFDEVDLGGALTTKSTLHNISIIKLLKLGIGDIIKVYRANMVIPKVSDNLTRSNNLIIPDRCPVCGGQAVIHNDKGSETLHCNNPSCSAKIMGKLTHFVSRDCMNVEGLSSAIIETLTNEGMISSFKDIYNLEKYRDKIVLLSGFGIKSYENLIASIEKSREVRLDKFINALGIPNIGKVASKQLAEKYNYDFNDFYYSGVSFTEDYTQIKDFGEVAHTSLINFFKEENTTDAIRQLASEMNFIKPEIKTIFTDSPFVDKTFCITGSFACGKRDELQKKIEELGGKFVSGVSKKTDILVAGDKCGSKLDKAKQFGTRIIEEEELKQILRVN